LSNNNYILKSLLNTLSKNNIPFVNANISNEKCSIRLVIDKQYIPLIKLLKEKLTNNQYIFNAKSFNGNFDIEINTNNLKQLIDMRLLIENYFSINKRLQTNISEEEIINYILNEYTTVSKEYIDY
jgi:hypothetical protein